MIRNDIGFGIFCFGEDYYYKGAIDKVERILDAGYECYALTENPSYFKRYFNCLNIIPYYRDLKSYHDKMILPKHILKDCQYSILLDADLDIKDWSFLDDLRQFEFKDGISYGDVLTNHPSRLKYAKDIEMSQTEWSNYKKYADSICPSFSEFEMIWEYFLVINKDGFKSQNFYYWYEKLQLSKEFSELTMKKEVNGCGEGLSIQIASNLSNTPIQRDNDLYDIIKDKMKSVSTRFSRP